MYMIDTHSGILPAALILIAIIAIAVPLIMRKLTLRQLICAVVLAAAMIFWLIQSLGTYVIFGGALRGQSIDVIPFSSVLLTVDDFGGLLTQQELWENCIAPQLFGLSVSLGFGIVWGITAAETFNLRTAKKITVISFAVMLPLELAINLAALSGIVYSYRYDTARYLLTAAGITGGWFIRKGVMCLKKERRDDNDK